MATLVSPGISITVIDESPYVSGAIGTTPFVLLATAENKLFNNSIAKYTTAAFANQLLAVTSQRDLVTNFGYPIFSQSASGTPLNGAETNEYGLMAAYSALGVSNLMYIIRADIDLNQLHGTAVRPIGAPANGTYWLDLTNTNWGIYEWNAVTQSYTSRTPMVITHATDTWLDGGIVSPLPTIGSIGSYAVIANSPNNYVFYKGSDNNWVQVGSPVWQDEWAAVSGTSVNPTLVPATGTDYNISINGVQVTFAGTTVSLAASSINSASIPGVIAAVVNGSLALYANSAATNSAVVIADGTIPSLLTLGLTAGSYAAPEVSFGGYVAVPDWRSTDTKPAPSGSVWVKTSVLGKGADIVLKEYASSSATWSLVSTPIYADDTAAIYAMDPNAGGNGIQAGTVYVKQDALNNGTVSFHPMIRTTQGALVVTGDVPNSPMVFTSGNSFEIVATQLGLATTSTTVITLTTNTPQGFVAAIQSANIPFVTASLAANGAISIGHSQGGSLVLSNVTGTPLTTAGFTTATNGIQATPAGLLASNFQPLIYTYSTTTPYTAPADGTLWYYNSPLDCDIMINETTGWKGYKNVSKDARGYNLVNTDPAGVILSPIQPTTQSDLTALVPGDLWVSTAQADLVNFPVIRRYTGSVWQLIDNTDVVDQNGIVFADARWDTNGMSDPAAGAYPVISDLLTSNYVDLDCPDHRLYPRGTLLFNLRRSGYNVKHYVSNYFNEQAYPDMILPTVSATWVTSSGLKNSGAPFMGSQAQRNMVVKAMSAAIDTNETLREETFQFNLQCAPGYPELIPHMVALNNDRANTAFVIGDTPMHLQANPMTTTNWSTDADGTGLATADPYMGVYYPSGLSTDLNGNTIVVPPSHAVLRTAIRSDNVSYPWFAFAGTRRGTIDNITDIGYVDSSTGAFMRNGINQGMRDSLYVNNINPITILPGVGITLYGNKTRIGVASALDRVNVARLVNYIRAMLAHVGDAFLFEQNDKTSWDQIKHIVSASMNDLVAKRGIYDYLVVCDSSNNTPDRIARNELYVDIAISPEKDIEFIYVPIRLVNPGTLGK